MVNCPNCGNQAGEGAVFCDQCGTRLPPVVTAVPEVVTEVAPDAGAAPEPIQTPAAASVICGACGAGNVPGELFCDFCGSPLDAPVPVVEAPAPTETPADAEAAREVEPVQAEPVLACPACGAEVRTDEAFCDDCGASLAQPPIPPEPVVEEEADIEAQIAADLDAEIAAEEAKVVADAEPVVEEALPDVDVVAAPEPVVEPATLVVELEPGPPTCPACGELVETGDKFCSNCGAVLEAQPATPLPAPAVTPAAPVIGARLVVQDTGAEIPLPAQAEILIGREDPVSGIFPDIDLTPHGGEAGGVSRRHARLIVESGSHFVEDLDSTNFTFVNKQKLAPRTRHPVQDGDEVRCGRVALILKL